MECLVEDCLKEKANYSGYCRRHYRSYNLYGNPRFVDRPKSTSIAYALTLEEGPTVLPEIDLPSLVDKPCVMKDCLNNAFIKGFCKEHCKSQYNSEINNIEVDIIWHKNSGGYLSGRYNGKNVLQHRHVFEQHIGRSLQGYENIHHINGIRDDNRIENLELWSVSQPPGQRVADRVAWALECLREYSPEALSEEYR